ncbi:MAG: hypothetical protein ABR506_07550, partial [Candidatus Krumholzibacteriia bacterium]
GWVLAALLTAVCAVPSAPAQDATGGLRAPVLLFISGTSSADLPLPVAEVRTIATAALAEALAAAGFAVVPAADLLPHLQERRVRTAWSTSAAFLHDLAAGTGSTHVLVAVLLAEQGHLQLLARLTRLQDGSVVWATVAEQAVPRAARRVGSTAPVDADAWLDGLRRLCRAGTPDPLSVPPAGAGPLVLVPARAVACAQEVALAATHCLLVPAAAAARWRVVDPGVVAAHLRDEGVPTDRLDAAGRARLGRELGDFLLALPEIMIYDESGTGVRTTAAEDFGEPAPPAQEYELGLRLVDPRDGIVTAGFVRHRGHGPRVGWFGRRTDRTLLAGLAGAARSLWSDLDNTLEDR